MPSLQIRQTLVSQIRSLAVALLVVAVCPAAQAAVSPLPTLEPTPVLGETAKTIVKQLQSEHYVSLKLDDSLSGRMLDSYLELLDPGRNFFLASDIAEFQKRQFLLDDELKAGKLDTGFIVYRRYLDRYIARLQSTIDTLPKTVEKLDFTRNETLNIDRRNAPWPADMQAADELWRKQIKNRVLSLKLADKTNGDIVDLLTKRFSSQLGRVKQSTPEDVFQLYMSALAGLYDPHTDYFSPRISENFQINMSLKLEGIGAVLQSEDEYTKVVRLVPAGPAAKQGQLQPADRIIAVAEGRKGEFKDIVGWRLDDVVDLIRGPKGSVVRLQVIPASVTTEEVKRVIAIERNEVKLEEQSAQKRMIEVYKNDRLYKVGVIDVPTFYLDFEGLRNGDPNYRSTTRDVQRLLDELLAEGAEGIVIDLRDNGGGSLAEANALTGLFIQSGPTVQIRYANSWVKREGKRRNTAYYEGPLAVLINRMSASASEIFAAAIQDYQRGVIIGSQSFGKGTVQSINPLEHGQLKLTESKFYRISGESTQNRGVIPDIDFPEIYDQAEVGESALDNPLPWDRIEPVMHPNYHDIRSALPRLQAAHKERIKHDPDFRYLTDQLSAFDEFGNRKEVSLNLETRRAEREKQRARQLEIENRRRVAKGMEPLARIDAETAGDEDESTATAPDLPTKQHTDETPDPLLVEASNILVDAFSIYGQTRIAEHAGKDSAALVQ